MTLKCALKIIMAYFALFEAEQWKLEILFMEVKTVSLNLHFLKRNIVMTCGLRDFFAFRTK